MRFKSTSVSCTDAPGSAVPGFGTCKLFQLLEPFLWIAFKDTAHTSRTSWAVLYVRIAALIKSQDSVVRFMTVFLAPAVPYLLPAALVLSSPCHARRSSSNPSARLWDG
eukprot:5897581-Amphidinium_carterae.1